MFSFFTVKEKGYREDSGKSLSGSQLEIMKFMIKSFLGLWELWQGPSPNKDFRGPITGQGVGGTSRSEWGQREGEKRLEDLGTGGELGVHNVTN